MKTIERNWSALTGYQGAEGERNAYWTREEWLAKAIEWSDLNEEDYNAEERQEVIDMLGSMDDEDLMQFISENWDIEIRETTWLKVGNECFWEDPEGLTSGVCTILEIRCGEWDALDEDTILLITDGWGENEVFLRECLGLTDKTCPRCGKPLYVSDLCRYPYVCFDCDENFYEEELR
jgi:hypothetical protein